MMLRPLAASLFVVLLSLPALTASKQDLTRAVDSGSFGIFVAGRRVATEKFDIRQGTESSIASAHLTIEDGSNAEQSAELVISSSGNLKRYTWRELRPGKAEAVVEPSDQFLVQHILATPTEKPTDQTFLLPPSTMVLDDYFFSHRQILAWRYLAAGCKGVMPCDLKKAQMGVIVPRQRLSTLVTIAYQGRDKLLVHGSQQVLDRFLLETDGVDWQLWLDSDYKLVRILIPSDNTEVLRD